MFFRRCCLCKLLLAAFGLGWLFGRPRGCDGPEAAEWRERRRRFRAKLREAFRELRPEDEPEA